MQINKLKPWGIARASVAVTLVAVMGAICCGLSYASEKLQPGNRYKIIGPLYLTGIYDDLNNRKLSWADLSPVRSSGPEVAFQRKVPVGTIMFIIGPAQKRVPLPIVANRYFVRLEPTDLPSDINVILELNRGIEGSLDGLNPEFFARP